MHKSRFYTCPILLAFILLASRCANPVTPEGGPKDVTPPKVLKCEPVNGTVNFNYKDVTITFDEFVNVSEPLNKILVSPPFKKPPDYNLRGKNLIIGFEEPLIPATTYSINMGQAISDITENNILKQFSYVFSTGPVLDSLTVEGHITDAFNGQPVKDVFVMLYPAHGNDTVPLDSLPMKTLPRYITRSDDQGSYSLDYLAPGQYLLFALEDKSGDKLFNQPNERIAFYDSLVMPWYVPPPLPDSLRDSLAPTVKARAVDLTLFEQADSTQVLLKTALVNKNRLMLSFKLPVRKLALNPVGKEEMKAGWSLEEYSQNKDTVQVWVTAPPGDTLTMAVYDINMKPDTISICLIPKYMQKKPKKDEEPPRQKLDLTTNFKGNTYNQFKIPFIVISGYPVESYDLSSAKLISEKDTVPARFELADTLKRKFMLVNTWKEGVQYRLFVKDSAWITSDGLYNDTIRYDFRTTNLRDLGSLILDLTMNGNPGNYIVQLLTEKENLVSEQYVTGPGKVSFPFLMPGKFKVKMILDKNLNRRWDSGIFVLRRQPEKVVYYPSVIEVRANWDVENPFDL